jgi:hypothetical protein
MLRADLLQQLHRGQLYLKHDPEPQPNQLIVPMDWLHGMLMQHHIRSRQCVWSFKSTILIDENANPND